MDADLQRLADAAESLERQARELSEQIAELANAMRTRAGEEAATQSNGVGADDSEARLVAYSMVLDGKSREEVASHLQEELGLVDCDALLDDLYARADE